MIPSQFIEAAERAFFSAIAALRSRWKSAADVRHVIATQLDPLLKAADELEGKLRSHAVEDFIDFREMPSKDFSPIDLVNLCSTLYLFAQFRARLEILRRESFNADLAQDSQGKVLLRFLRSLESKRVRLVDRAWQRAIGESLMVTGRSTEVLTFKDFVELYEVDPRRCAWLQPLENALRETKYPRARQRVLQYGVVVHALIDTLDPKHYTTKDRPGYSNKLSRRAKRELIARVFGIYLPDVRRTEKYTGIRLID